MPSSAKLKTWKTKNAYSIIRILRGRSNVFLLTDGTTNILVDTSVPRLWNKLKKRLYTLNINRIDYLILTHTHFDHAGNARKIKETYGARVIIHQAETSYLTEGENPMPRGTTLITRCIVNQLAKRFMKLLKYSPCPYDITIDKVLSLEKYGFNAYITHTPGHSPGSVSVIIDNEVALVGDTMFGVFKGSAFPPYAEDVGLMMQSWGSLLRTDCSVFIPFHGSSNSRQLVQKDFLKRMKNNYRERPE